MSISAVVPSPSSSIDLNDPQLTTIPAAWAPPSCYDELSRDECLTVDALAAMDLYGKATDLCTCCRYFIRILEFGTHWARLGKATCHLKFACRNCGTGKSRAHRLWTVNAKRYAAITEDVTRTLRLTIPYSAPSASVEEYRVRVESAKAHLQSLRARIRRQLRNRQVGLLSMVEMDPKLQFVAFRIYYVGPDPTPRGLRHEWRELAGAGATSESRTAWDSGADALRWMLDGSTAVLMLQGEDRATWERVFQGFRLTSSCGSLRGIDLDAPVSEDDVRDAAAPYGYCPCGCGGVVEKAKRHAPTSLTRLTFEYDRVEFGPLKDYCAYSPTVALRPSEPAAFGVGTPESCHPPPS